MCPALLSPPSPRHAVPCHDRLPLLPAPSQCLLSCRHSAAYEGLELRLKGDGQRYKCVIRSDSGWDAVGYTASFDTQPGGKNGSGDRGV